MLLGGDTASCSLVKVANRKKKGGSSCDRVRSQLRGDLQHTRPVMSVPKVSAPGSIQDPLSLPSCAPFLVGGGLAKGQVASEVAVVMLQSEVAFL